MFSAWSQIYFDIEWRIERYIWPHFCFQRFADSIRHLRSVAYFMIFEANIGTLKYHKTLREGVCSNCQECRHMGRRGVWPNRHNFYHGWKSLGGKGLAENVRIPSYDIWTFPIL